MTTHAAPKSEKARREPGQFKDDANAFCDQPPTLSSPRELRLLSALLDGPVSREALDRGIGASNTPDVVFRLRSRGFDLPCERRRGIDRDGRTCRFGVYRLSDTDADKARAILSEGGV